MIPWIQIIVGIGVGIVSLGLLVFIFCLIFNRLDTKLDKAVFEEYAKRIADNLEAGKKRFDKIDDALGDNTNALNQLCKEVVALQTLFKERGK